MAELWEGAANFGEVLPTTRQRALQVVGKRLRQVAQGWDKAWGDALHRAYLRRRKVGTMKSSLVPVALLLLLLATSTVVSGEDRPMPAGMQGSEPSPLNLRPKSVITPSPLARAPFVAVPGEPVLDLLPREEDPRLKESKSSCSRGTSLCYDSGSNKLVYKGTRAYMPDLPGLRAEHISVRRDRITFKYSFQ